jgi:serine/threonine-protein kinase HipA
LRPDHETSKRSHESYETSIMKRFTDFANSSHVGEDLERLFTLIAINCALRNGDAHLKNFGILYDDVQGEARLAPVYDLVTTSVYLPRDSMALTLNGTTKWPSANELQRLGETRMGGSLPASEQFSNALPRRCSPHPARSEPILRNMRNLTTSAPA